jgi:hypothetical protein
MKSAFKKYWDKLGPTIPTDPQEVARRAFNAGLRAAVRECRQWEGAPAAAMAIQKLEQG